MSTSAARRRYVSPLRYPGGKARLAPFLSEVFAAQVGSMDVEVWIEPFAGGAGAGLTLLDAGAVGEVWLTEKDPAIAALWRVILTDGPRLADWVEATTANMSLWHWARQTITEPDPGDWDLARAALVINRCSRSGIIHPAAGPIGGKSQDGRWTVTSRWNGPGLAGRITRVHSLAGSVRFTQGDAIDRIRDLAGCGFEDEVLVFVDPPYLREGNRLYAHGMTMADHEDLAAALNACPARWLATYDDEPVVTDRLYPDRRVLAFGIPNTANRARVATEYLIASDNVDLPPWALTELQRARPVGRLATPA